MNKVLIAMSGGIDSSVAAVLLQRMGYEVIGATMRLWKDSNNLNSNEKTDSSVNDAKSVCDKLGIKHYVFDYSDEFEEHVINNFLSEYMNGRTPNPCIVCNKKFKFGMLFEKSKELGTSYISTGHYAKVYYDDNIKKYILSKANSHTKDQSYVLYNMTQEILSHTIFPLGDFDNKEEIRRIATDIGLDIANKPDSQEICFIPDDDYISYVTNKVGTFEKGNIVDLSGNILGIHNGIINYTIGQRKGLGISNKVPLFVIKIDANKNEIVVGEEKDTYSNYLFAENMNYILHENLNEPLVCSAKIRYSAKQAICTLYHMNNKKCKIIFNEPQKAITPGQSVVLYDNNIVLGGGIIC